MLQFNPGARFRAIVEVQSQAVRVFKFVCPECGEEFGGYPHEYDVQGMHPTKQVFECCGVPCELLEQVDVTVRHGKEGRVFTTWETVFEEPVTLAMYRAVYGEY